MALSPNAPDYVGSVRGILDDLRNNFLKKQQLFQENEQAADRLELAYAQLGAQRETQNLQANLEAQKLQASILSDAQRTEQQNFQNNLASARLSLDQNKELNTLDAQSKAAEQDRQAGVLETEFRAAQLSGDPQRIDNALGKIGQANLTRLQRVSLYDNVYSGIQANRELAQQENNLRTATPARSLGEELAKLDPRAFTPDAYQARVDEIQDKFSLLNNTDPRVIEPFAKVSATALAKLEKYRDTVVGKELQSFQDLAEQNRLEPNFQKKYDELKNDPNKFTSKAVQGIMYERNLNESVKQLRGIDSRLTQIASNITKVNPSTQVTNVDQNGQEYDTFIYPIPDLSPRVGFDANIDPDTGRLTKNVLDRAKDWENEMTSPRYAGQQTPFEKMMAAAAQNSSGRAVASAPPQAPSTAVSTRPFRSGNNFELGAPGTATIPVAAKKEPARMSDSTVSVIVEAYRKNPDSLVFGRSAKDLVAKLKANGYPIQDLLKTPKINESQQNR